MSAIPLLMVPTVLLLLFPIGQLLELRRRTIREDDTLHFGVVTALGGKRRSIQSAMLIEWGPASDQRLFRYRNVREGAYGAIARVAVSPHPDEHPRLIDGWVAAGNLLSLVGGVLLILLWGTR